MFPRNDNEREKEREPRRVEIMKFILVINGIDVAHCVLILKYCLGGCRLIAMSFALIASDPSRVFFTTDTRTIADIYERTVVSRQCDGHAGCLGSGVRFDSNLKLESLSRIIGIYVIHGVTSAIISYQCSQCRVNSRFFDRVDHDLSSVSFFFFFASVTIRHRALFVVVL